MKTTVQASYWRNRRGFAIYFMFIVMFVVLLSGYLAQSLELLSIARLQKNLFSRESVIKPGGDWYLENLLGPAEMR